MKYAFYPGCSLHGTGIEFGLSTQAVAGKLGLDLREIEGWTCCGATPAHSTSHLLAASLSAINLARAQEQGAEQVITCCAACFSRLKHANHDIATDLELRRKVAEACGRDYDGTLPVRHLLEVLLEDCSEADLLAPVVRPLKGLKVASYYGCLLVRPPKVMAFDDVEDPSSMDRIASIMGAEPLDWTHKTECCGSSFSLNRTDMVLKMTGRVLEAAHAAGADAVLVACPLCHSNLDLRQPDINRRLGLKPLPILYFTQLMGLAYGIAPRRLGLNRHTVGTAKLARAAARGGG